MSEKDYKKTHQIPYLSKKTGLQSLFQKNPFTCENYISINKCINCTYKYMNHISVSQMNIVIGPLTNNDDVYIHNRGGSRFSSQGGGTLKKIVRAEGGANIFGVFRVKNHDFRPKNHIFSNFRGGTCWVRPPPGSSPA